MVKVPTLSIIVVFFNMGREAKRTLYTLSSAYQQGVTAQDYEVFVLDNGSTAPLSVEFVAGFGPNFHYRFYATTEKSPVFALNRQIEECRSEFVIVMIDGAHMLSPGVVVNALRAAQAYADPFVTVVGFHLGEENQNRSVSKGYNQEQEDELLESVDWRENGYRLFSVAQELSYDCAGWFGPLVESNCFLMKKESYGRLGGFDPRFTEVGGGLAILDFFRTVLESPELDYVVLLGEGSFHQFHDGVASNAPYAEHPWERFHKQYVEIRNRPFRVVARRPHLLGCINPEVDNWVRLCARVGCSWWLEEEREPHNMEEFFSTIGYAMLAAKADPEEKKQVAELEHKVSILQHNYDQMYARFQECAADLNEIARSPVWRLLENLRHFKKRIFSARQGDE